MTKSGLIEAVADRTPHISKKDTEIVVNTIFDAMAQALKTGERIEIAPSLSFSRPEPRQILLWDPVSDTLRRAEPPPPLLFRRCPDRPLTLMER